MSRHEAFGTLIRRARIAKNLALPAVASTLGLTAGYCRRIEGGRTLVSLRTFAALHQALQFDANPLLPALRQHSKPIEPTSKTHKRTTATAGLHELFGHALQRARIHRQFRQKDVAQAINCSEHYYRRIEAGHVLPSLLVFAKIHHCLGFEANGALATLSQKPPRAPYHKFGSFLADARQELGLTVHEAANATGCSSKAYRCIEAGKRLPTMHQFVWLHRTLGFRADSALRRIPLGKFGKALITMCRSWRSRWSDFSDHHAPILAITMEQSW